jgi:hypothetical protein
MTTDSEQPPTPEEMPTTPSETDSGGTDSGFTSPTGMVALGGLVLIGTWVVFGVLLNDYWVGWLALLLSVISLLLLRANSTFVEKLAPVPVLTKIVGYLLAIIGLFVLIEDLRFADGTLNEFPDVVGALAAYAGYVIAFLGARSIKA